MSVIGIAQERQSNHCDKLIVYDGARCHAIGPLQQLGFPTVQFRIKIFSEIKHVLSANIISNPTVKHSNSEELESPQD